MDQLSVAESVRHELLLKQDRGALPADYGSVDPEDGWPYSDRNGLYLDDVDTPPVRGNTADPLAGVEFTVRKNEVKCTRCFYVHPASTSCEEVW